MASTPPPLPSSSEDSDFDDDDFGCFSSAPPVKTPSSALKNVEHSGTGALKQTEQFLEIDRSDSALADEKCNRSEYFGEAYGVSAESENNILSTENCDSQISYPIDNLHVSSSTFQSVMNDNSGEEQEKQNDSSSGMLEDKVVLSESIKDATENSKASTLHSKIEDGDPPLVEDKNNSKVEETEESLEAQLATEVSSDCCGKQGEDEGNGSKLEQNKNDQQIETICVENNSSKATEFGDSPKEKKDTVLTEDEFTDWNDAQDLNSSVNTNDNVDDVETADQKDEENVRSSESCNLDADCDHSDDANDESNGDNTFSTAPHITDHIPFQTVETSATGDSNFDCDFGAFDENKDAMFTSDYNNGVAEPDNSLQDPSSLQDQIENDTEIVAPRNDFIDDQDEDDDDFGDFADFSSHQAFESNTKEDDIPPISFRTSTTDQDNEKSADNKNSDSSNATATDFSPKQDVSNSGVKVNGNSAEDDYSDDNEDDDDDDDDWGFKSADAAVDNDNFRDESGGQNNEDDWASFNESPSVVVASSTTTNAVDDDDDDEFDDFSGSTTQTTPFTAQTDPSLFKTQEGSSKVEKVFFMCFPSISTVTAHPVESVSDQSCDMTTSVPNEDSNEVDALASLIEMGLKVTPHAKEETWTIVKELRNKDPVVGTWGRLKDVNSCHALVYGWNTSHCCQEVFSTLHIDTKNVLFSQKKQAVPFYASGLGILEPIRGGPNPAEKPQQPPQPNLLDTDKSEEESKKVLDIPPVDFDWGSSGLTNPLKVFKADSFNNGLSSLDSFTDVLQKNMEPTKELSAEAKSILAKMPNLNFMRSNVLMFPIKD